MLSRINATESRTNKIQKIERRKKEGVGKKERRKRVRERKKKGKKVKSEKTNTLRLLIFKL